MIDFKGTSLLNGACSSHGLNYTSIDKYYGYANKHFKTLSNETLLALRAKVYFFIDTTPKTYVFQIDIANRLIAKIEKNIKKG